MILLDVADVGAARPDKVLFSGVSFTVTAGDRLGVVGINGSGKTTLLRILAGVDQPDEGTVRRGRGIRLGFLDQHPVLPAGSVRDAVGGDWRGDELLDLVGMAPFAGADVATLSGGQAKRVALAGTLVTEADLLILDEPTNHLDIDAIDWLEERLATFSGGLILVTHDRHLLDRVCTRILELDRGQAFLHNGGYEVYLSGRSERERREAAAEATRRILARRELEWLRRGAPARTRKPKARIEAATAIVEGSGPRPARLGQIDLVDAAAAGTPGYAAGARAGSVGWGAAGTAKRHPATPRLGDKVIVLDDVGHRFDGRPWLFRHLDLTLDNRERLGIVGPNGGGKSTLLDLMARRFDPVEGRVVWGPTVVLGYYDQTGETLPLDRRVRDLVAGPGRQPDWYDTALLERFWFDTNAQYAPASQLSGGERRRLQLLLTLATRPNVLLLDEPTNDLDLDTLRALEDFLDDWPGALVVVSHDRAFLERTVTDVIVLDPAEGTSERTTGRRPGGYAEWEAQRRDRRHRHKATVRSATAGSGRERPKSHSRSGAGPAGSSLSTLRHRLKQAERELAVCQRRQEELEAQLAIASGHEELARIGRELATATAELNEVEERWLEIAGQLEAAEAARLRRA
ncbi:MAG: ABC-F family ATP-binding cassette domain-containing protein [Acidimicrobiales bacterium]|nr:ABC-F family ATP-binding cassette domain-containing protein [Acidimicrobiales bacterium]